MRIPVWEEGFILTAGWWLIGGIDGHANQKVGQRSMLLETPPELRNGVAYPFEMNEPFCIVHQYDRDNVWAREISERYVTPFGVLSDDEVTAVWRQAFALTPSFPTAHLNLGHALKEMGQLDQAITAFRRAIIMDPNFAEAYSALGDALIRTWQFDEAIAVCQHAIALDSSLYEAHNTLGIALAVEGQLDEAFASWRRAVALNPYFSEAHDNLLLYLPRHPSTCERTLADELRRWNVQHAEPLTRFIEPPAEPGAARRADRRLRIGYVSPDLREHPLGRLLLPVLTHHDKTQVEVFAYANVPYPDGITQQLRSWIDHWRDIGELSDPQTADLIRHDRIDILVDLSSHTPGNRLLVFARKPAPVQVSWLGYPGSTGLTTIDYRLSDPYLDPPDVPDSFSSEKTIRLPDSFWCYAPPDVRESRLRALPALETGVVSCACLNDFSKINDFVLTLWARVLCEVEGSRLLLAARPGSHQRHTTTLLARHGVAPTRVKFLNHQPYFKYLEYYHDIDLGLDCFPYNGHTTSLDSFWMGVPVVTLVGQTAVSRAGWCYASNLRLPELAAHTPEEFVRIAVDLARDLPRLSHLRSTLRQRMLHSPLMDAERFARNLEAAYREMWRAHCTGLRERSP